MRPTQWVRNRSFCAWVVLLSLASGCGGPPLPEGPLLVFSRHYLRPIYLEDRPALDEVDRPVRLSAARGETEPASVGVFAREPLTGATLTPTELTGPDGETLPKSVLGIRVTRYIEPRRRWPKLSRHPLHPGYLDAKERFDVASGTSRQLWITAEVPENAAPGTYRGELVLAAAGRERGRLPVELTIHPFTLDPPGPIYFLHGDNFPLEAGKFALSRRYGMNTINVNHGWAKQVVPEYARGRFEFARGFPPVERAIELAREHGLGVDRPIGVGMYSHLTQAVPFALARADVTPPGGEPIDELNFVHGYEVFFPRRAAVEGAERMDGPYYPVPDPAAPPQTRYGRELYRGWVESLRTLDALSEQRGWPSFFYYLIDEPHHSRGTMRLAIQMARASAEAGADGLITCNEPTMSEPDADELWFQPLENEPALRLEPWVQTRCYHNKYVGPETRRRTEQADDRYGTYVNVYGNRPASVRYQSGLLAWRARLELIMLWNFKNVAVAHGDGYSVLRDLEAAREGIDDLRYVETLERLLNEDAGTPEARAAARAVLDEMRRTLEPTARGIGYVDGVTGRWVPGDDSWEPERFDELRGRVAAAIASLLPEEDS
jgi:hypothetical protein